MAVMRKTIRLVILAALLGVCQVPASVAQLPFGDLRTLEGSWEGAWSGVPIKLVITAQQGAYVAGIVTLGLPEGWVSTAVTGRLSTSAGRLTLSLLSESPVGRDYYEFASVQADQLSGHAQSFRPGFHQGVVTLRRRSA